MCGTVKFREDTEKNDALVSAKQGDMIPVTNPRTGEVVMAMFNSHAREETLEQLVCWFIDPLAEGMFSGYCLSAYPGDLGRLQCWLDYQKAKRNGCKVDMIEDGWEEGLVADFERWKEPCLYDAVA